MNSMKPTPYAENHSPNGIGTHRIPADIHCCIALIVVLKFLRFQVTRIKASINAFNMFLSPPHHLTSEALRRGLILQIYKIIFSNCYICLKIQTFYGNLTIGSRYDGDKQKPPQQRCAMAGW